MVLKTLRRCVWALIVESVRWVILVLRTALITRCLAVRSIWPAALESSAESNEILISKDTYQLIKDAVHCIDKGQIPIKGFAEAVDVYSAVDLHKHLKSDCPVQRQRQALA